MSGDGFLKGLLLFCGALFTSIYAVAHASGGATSGTVVYLILGLLWIAGAGWLAFLGRRRS